MIQPAAGTLVQVMLIGVVGIQGTLMADTMPLEIDPSGILQWLMLCLLAIIMFFVRNWINKSEGVQQDVSRINSRLDRIETRLDVVCPLWSRRATPEEVEKHLQDHNA